MEFPWWRQCIQCLGVCVCVWAWKAQISSDVPRFPVPRGPSGAAGVVYDQRDVNAVHLKKVDQEGAIALGI